jgi:hypothetical protein
VSDVAVVDSRAAKNDGSDTTMLDAAWGRPNLTIALLRSDGMVTL